LQVSRINGQWLAAAKGLEVPAKNFSEQTLFSAGK